MASLLAAQECERRKQTKQRKEGRSKEEEEKEEEEEEEDTASLDCAGCLRNLHIYIYMGICNYIDIYTHM